MSNVKLKIKKGDKVVVLTGKDKTKTGEVLKVFPEDNRVLVQGINLAKKHTKPSATSAGGIETKEMPIHASNVALIDPKSNKPTRVGYTTLKDGKKVRVARRSGETLDK
ncbi:50S ribosomal protein L24 [Micavibrio aeruginosavorus]|jgi:large subunit ribosomal protein L24|uniref:50S ribosomal protein L24 n=1 Tax=Micavibrio aeruginosavorus TaxID=349221 RepID=UPI003F4A8B41